MNSCQIRLLILATGALLASGCSDSGFVVVPVSGKVVCHGAPIKSGYVLFAPIGADSSQMITGKSGTAELSGDGMFVLSTYSFKDGAIVGQHEVNVRPLEEGQRFPKGCGLAHPIRFEVPKEGLAGIVIDIGTGSIN